MWLRLRWEQLGKKPQRVSSGLLQSAHNVQHARQSHHPTAQSTRIGFFGDVAELVEHFLIIANDLRDALIESMQFQLLRRHIERLRLEYLQRVLQLSDQSATVLVMAFKRCS